MCHIVNPRAGADVRNHPGSTTRASLYSPAIKMTSPPDTLLNRYDYERLLCVVTFYYSSSFHYYYYYKCLLIILSKYVYIYIYIYFILCLAIVVAVSTVTIVIAIHGRDGARGVCSFGGEGAFSILSFNECALHTVSIRNHS